MYSKLPNLVIAFHGCNDHVYENVLVKHQHLKPSINDYDWLGNGIYFWENSLQRAQEWAVEQCIRHGCGEPKVIGAIIDLGYCLNLTDSAYTPMLKSAYELLCTYEESMGEDIPKNSCGEDLLLRRLDCAVIQQLHIYNEMMAHADETYQEFDSVRGVFIEGPVIYKESQFREKTHIQLCIRNQNCIKGYFDPLTPIEYCSMP